MLACEMAALELHASCEGANTPTSHSVETASDQTSRCQFASHFPSRWQTLRLSPVAENWECGRNFAVAGRDHESLNPSNSVQRTWESRA